MKLFSIIYSPIRNYRINSEKKKLEKLRTGDPKKLADYLYYKLTHRHINWSCPKDINEKIQWLKFYGDTSLWPICADKLAVRDFVQERGCGDLLVKLYGSWEKAEDITWNSLPNKFVMKVNNGSGDVLICNNKANLDINEETKKFASLLDIKFGSLFAEPHYNLIKPSIICEELLDCHSQSIKTTSLVDYKFFCFDGKPTYVWTCYNRTPKSVEVALYDLDWNYHPEKSVFTNFYKKANILLPKPVCFEEMFHAASLLSKGFPQVRIDFYEVNGKPYFGEMTFTSEGGYMIFFTQKFLDELGSYVKLTDK